MALLKDSRSLEFLGLIEREITGSGINLMDEWVSMCFRGAYVLTIVKALGGVCECTHADNSTLNPPTLNTSQAILSLASYVVYLCAERTWTP